MHNLPCNIVCWARDGRLANVCVLALYWLKGIHYAKSISEDATLFICMFCSWYFMVSWHKRCPCEASWEVVILQVLWVRTADLGHWMRYHMMVKSLVLSNSDCYTHINIDRVSSVKNKSCGLHSVWKWRNIHLRTYIIDPKVVTMICFMSLKLWLRYSVITLMTKNR